jgi:hypothetical protein
VSLGYDYGRRTGSRPVDRGSEERVARRIR